jgi:hypothetical protein
LQKTYLTLFGCVNAKKKKTTKKKTIFCCMKKTPHPYCSLGVYISLIFTPKKEVAAKKHIATILCCIKTKKTPAALVYVLF